MSLTRLKYGIETDSKERDNDHPGLGWLVVSVVVIAAISFIVTVIGRISSDDPGSEPPEAPSVLPEKPKPVPPAPSAKIPPVEMNGLEKRSPKVRSLLLRLEKCAEAGELEMQISTIEQIRAIRGADADDLAEELLPRLGQLNLSWLFDKNNPQWVTRVKVKNGDTTSRIAAEHGSTLASLKKLNGISDAHRLKAGCELKVMDHPRFYLVLRTRLRAIDLYLNGKIFKRYFLPGDSGEIGIKPGDYKTPANLRDYFRRNSLNLRRDDLEELNMLVPVNSRLNVSPT